MLNDLINFPERFFAAQNALAIEFAHWVIRQVERIPEPVRRYIPLKSSPIDPEIEQVRQLEQSPQEQYPYD